MAEALRAVAAVALLLPARAMLRSAPRGDGRPVMLLPGLFNSDRSMIVMRRFLAGLGYDVAGWGLGRNFGARTIGADGDLLIDRVRAHPCEERNAGDARRRQPRRHHGAARAVSDLSASS